MKRISKLRKRRGFTLVELTITILLGMAIVGMLMAVFNQQLLFLKLFRTQNFLIDEAPMINMQVSRLVSKAERFRLHETTADALKGTGAVSSDAKVLVMNFRQPDGSMRATMLSWENNQLLYYIVPTEGELGAAQWTVTNKPFAVTFGIVDGVLRMTLTGTAGEQITYSGTVQSSGAIQFDGTASQ
ncbi:MAG: hypothetical protein QM680_14390 [Luteolibacter sp.]